MRSTVRTSAIITTLLAGFALTLLAATPAVAHDKQGYIYGTITTHSGNSYTGLIRWDDEETFWDDLFHSYKEELPNMKYLEDAEEHSEVAVKELEREQKRLEKMQEELAAFAEELEKELDRAKSDEEREELREERLELLENRGDLIEELGDLMAERAKVYAKRDKRVISVLGGAIQVNINPWTSSSRIFICRFGDIAKLRVTGDSDAELTMRDGEVYEVSGYSNDVGSDIQVRDAMLGDVSLKWRNIETVVFSATPRDVNPEGYRLRGTLTADGGNYTGFIQWDSEECLSTDLLDGDSEDGDVSIPMGNIKSIERRTRRSSKVTLWDGRQLILDGSNDVDHSIRGILVQDERFGRVKVSWDAFDKVEFEEGPGESGKGYDAYADVHDLYGTIVLNGGKEMTGRIVWDVDEARDWEMLNGDLFDLEFEVPFEKVSMVQPRSSSASIVTFVGGEELRLEGGHDVSSSNDGLLLFEKGVDKPTLVEWEQVEQVRFDFGKAKRKNKI